MSMQGSSSLPLLVEPGSGPTGIGDLNPQAGVPDVLEV
jgi:hypothetical protein